MVTLSRYEKKWEIVSLPDLRILSFLSAHLETSSPMIVEKIFVLPRISRKSCEVAVVVYETLLSKCWKNENRMIRNSWTWLVSKLLFKISSFTISTMQNLQIYTLRLWFMDFSLLAIMMRRPIPLPVLRLVNSLPWPIHFCETFSIMWLVQDLNPLSHISSMRCVIYLRIQIYHTWCTDSTRSKISILMILSYISMRIFSLSMIQNYVWKEEYFIPQPLLSAL